MIDLDPRLTCLVLLTLLAGCAAAGGGPSSVAGSQSDAARPEVRPRPLVIAHRGASGDRPEHTLEAYRLAVEQGADYLEPDLVITLDGVLVARHENEIGQTTDVADRPEFADRRTTKMIDGAGVTGWFAEDFTLAELRTLRARERIPRLRPANTAWDDRFPIPTLEEIIELARSESRRTGRVIGIYPETKHPTYFRSIGLPLEEPLVETLHRHGWRDATAPVYIQSFEVANLRKLRRMTDLRLVQLLDSEGRPHDFEVTGDPRTFADLATPAGLRGVAEYAQGIGPHRDLVIPRDLEGRLGEPTSLVRDAHAAGLVVHPWTFRSENFFLPTDLRRGDPDDPAFPRQRGDAAAEYHHFFGVGVDGVFSDHPADAVAALR
jgi:glycerophosphoryl diester phosphodiesterase